MTRGIYAAPCEVVANRDREVIEEKSRLWLIDFTVTKFKGSAVIKAKNAKEAENILRTNGEFNGQPSLYQVTRIEEINESPMPMLICEQIND